jgi:MFS family permease
MIAEDQEEIQEPSAGQDPEQGSEQGAGQAAKLQREQPRPIVSLRRNRNFNIFWLGQGISSIGNSFGMLALPLLVLQATGSVTQMGLVTGTFGVGQLIAGIFAGIIIDRFDRRHLMMMCDLGRAILYGAIPVAWWLAGPQLWLIYVVAGVGAVLGNTFAVGNITALANLVEKHQITDANGRMQGTYSVAFLVGPMLAGFVSNQFGPTAAVGIDAFTFLASVASLAVIRLRTTPREMSPTPEGRFEGLIAGLRFVWREPVMRWLTVLLGIYSFLSFAGLDLFVYHLKNNLGQSDNTVGLVLGVSSVGGIVGAIIAARLRRRYGFAICWLGSSVLQAIALGAIGIFPYLITITAMLAFFQIANSIKGIMSMSLRQEITPDYLLGRVTSAFWMFLNMPGPIGAAVMTAFAERSGAPLAIGVMGIGGVVLAVIGFFTPIAKQKVL